MQTQKVVLQQQKSGQVGSKTPVYVVKRLINRLQPRVGDYLGEKEVKDLIAENRGTRKVTVEIVGGNS